MFNTPLHRNQHAYQPGKSCETALHRLVATLNDSLDRTEIALAPGYADEKDPKRLRGCDSRQQTVLQEHSPTLGAVGVTWGTYTAHGCETRFHGD